MDVDATLAEPIAMVFAHLAAPAHLGDWLAGVRGVEAAWPPDGAVFDVSLRVDDATMAATGELIACEPPWLATYRLRVGERTHIVRLTCTAHERGTRLQIHQGGELAPLAIDLERLRRALAARGVAAAPEGEQEGENGEGDR